MQLGQHLHLGRRQLLDEYAARNGRNAEWRIKLVPTKMRKHKGFLDWRTTSRSMPINFALTFCALQGQLRTNSGTDFTLPTGIGRQFVDAAATRQKNQAF